MSKNKVIILLLIFILIALGAYFYFARNSSGPAADTTDQEAESIKQANQQAIDQAGSNGLTGVPPVDASDYLKGESGAPLKLIVYSDFECPFCAAFNETIKQIEEQFSDQVAVAFRHFPLNIHPNALPAALAAECAGEQNQFWPMHDRLFALSKEHKLSSEQYLAAAAELKLDRDQFSQCLEQEKYQAKIISQMQAGRQAGVNGTPTTFINGQLLPGAYPFDDFVASDGQREAGLNSIIERLLNN